MINMYATSMSKYAVSYEWYSENITKAILD